MTKAADSKNEPVVCRNHKTEPTSGRDYTSVAGLAATTRGVSKRVPFIECLLQLDAVRPKYHPGRSEPTDPTSLGQEEEPLDLAVFVIAV